jgi:hypothetical protein
MDARQAFDVALDHYNKGENLLNYPEAVLEEEQALHFQRAAAHFSAGHLVLALALAERQLEAQRAAGHPAESGSPQ